MIALVTGTLVTRELDRVEIMTAGGVGYECLIPLSVFEGLPATGQQVTLHTHLSVREDAWHLYGFAHPL
ncbi:MAG: OB-fold domain-containing protein [Gemmatimonas sp.]|jgi:Holliday junction DNA helicase RuvA|uniref:OB-fold domain-containing protein n=1 Tax=Gemmatimonas sp. TaxID=1962908 RepID=UPI00391D5DAF